MKNVECYCSALRRATRRLNALYDTALEPVGVNIAQFSLLRNIHRNPRISLTELGRLVELDRSTIGRNIRVLERMGLAKIIAGDDQREAIVTVDTDGLRVLEEGAPLWDSVQENIEARIGDENAIALLRKLADLKDFDARS